MGVSSNSSGGKVADYDIEASCGSVAGHQPLRKEGHTNNVDMNVPTDIWDAANTGIASLLYVPPTVARTHNIVSSSTDDDGDPAGTGAQTVRIFGLDSLWVLQFEDVTMNGTTDVVTTKSFARITKMRVLTAGSGGFAAGNITATAVTDGTITMAIAAGVNDSRAAIFHVVAGTTAYIRHAYATIDKGQSASADAQLLVKNTADVAGSLYHEEMFIGFSNSSPLDHSFYSPVVVPEFSDIVMRALDCDRANTDISMGMAITVVTN